MNAPTLLVGLGGCGGKIISKVAKIVEEDQRIDIAQSNIAFAALDTDINELREIQLKYPFVKTIQTSTRQTVGEYLDKDTHARDTWFPVSNILNNKVLSEGAGQVRSVSRLALETVIRAGKMEPLHRAIQSLYKVEEDKPEQALRVIIVSSLAGGTGSGLILPVGMYIQQYLKMHFRQSANITRGFFVLPEVFFEVIASPTERNNLKANAYATLRELDAFLMKGDNTLPETYQNSVKMLFPRAAATGYEEYDVKPYDYCFLFDAQNAEGGKLNSFDQYLEHAANCIYAQSIGPMNKRSNSSEDNTIRKLVRERGRNRYAGAGASRLVYPSDDLIRMIALKWAKQCVSDQWLAYDNRYRELCRENAEKMAQGVSVREQTLSNFYVNQIDSMAKGDDNFAKGIVSATGIYKNGVTREDDKWERYITALMDKIALDLQDNPFDLDELRNQLNALGAEWEDYATTYHALEEYMFQSEARTEDISHTIAYALFRGSKGTKADMKQDYQLEKYLIGNDGKYMHPNAIRFMLIKILEEMSLLKLATDQTKNEIKEWLDTFESRTFDDQSTEDVQETADDVGSRKVKLIDKLMKRSSAEQEEIKRKLRDYFGKVGEYAEKSTQSVVLTEGINYITEMISAFEVFYTNLGTKVDKLDSEIFEIRKKYSGRKGMTVRYVCASAKCMDIMEDTMPYTGGVNSIDSELSRIIYDKVREYALMREKPNAKYFSDLFDKNIIGYFEESALKQYGSVLDVDIFTALETEARYECDIKSDTENADGKIDQYVRKVINDTRNLSCPFIESPLGEAREPLHACTFNNKLTPRRDDESPRAQLIRSELLNYGGEPDDGMRKNSIMFYQSYYGLRANNLSKFAPPEKKATYSRSGGEYFKAYYELIPDIHPLPHLSREISPHIDRWWHIVTKMPDLDEENQKRQEYDIYAAFFWAILHRFIHLESDVRDTWIYKINAVRLKMEDDTLTVSNGTDCDKLYEVLDSIAIYPKLAKRILEAVDQMTEDDIADNYPLEDSSLFSAIRAFYVEGVGIGPDNAPSSSIFDIPLLMKKSSKPEIYYEGNAVELLRVEIEEIKRYLSNFCNGKELPNVAGKLIMDQFEKHLDSLKLESESYPEIYRESLFEKTGDTIADALRSLGLRKEARMIREKVSELKK